MNKHLVSWMALVVFVGCSRVEPTPKADPAPAKAKAKTDVTSVTPTTPTTPELTIPSKHTTLLPSRAEDAVVVKLTDLGSTKIVVAGNKITFERDDPFATPTHLLFYAVAVYSNAERFPVSLVLVRMPPKEAGAVSSSYGSKSGVRRIDTPDGPRYLGEWKFSCLGGDPLLTLEHIRHGNEVRDTWKFAAATGNMSAGRVLLLDPFTKKIEQVSAELPADQTPIGLNTGNDEEHKKAEQRLRDLLGSLREKHSLVRDFLAPRPAGKAKDR